jgi:hypothetical protein
MKVVVREDKVYGRQLIYPVSENAVLLARLTKKITLTSAELEIIEKLGYAIEWEATRPTMKE